jgi:hypothetical protein
MSMVTGSMTLCVNTTKLVNGSGQLIHFHRPFCTNILGTNHRKGLNKGFFFIITIETCEDIAIQLITRWSKINKKNRTTATSNQ